MTILNKTTCHRNRYRLIPGSQGNYGELEGHPNHRYVVVNGVDRGNGYQGYTSVSYFLTSSLFPAAAKAALRKLLTAKELTFIETSKQENP